MSGTSIPFFSRYTRGTLNRGPYIVLKALYLFSLHFISHALLAAISGAVSKGGIQFPAVKDRRLQPGTQERSSVYWNVGKPPCRHGGN